MLGRYRSFWREARDFIHKCRYLDKGWNWDCALWQSARPLALRVVNEVIRIDEGLEE
jgi:hypothetical protein